MNLNYIEKKKHFRRNLLQFRIYGDYGTDNEINTSTIINKTNINNQKPNSFYIMSEMDGVLKNGYHDSALGYKNVDWFVDGIIKL